MGTAEQASCLFPCRACHAISRKDSQAGGVGAAAAARVGRRRGGRPSCEYRRSGPPQHQQSPGARYRSIIFF